MNSILWTVKAARQLRKLDRQHQMAIRHTRRRFRS